ncbi:MAG: hypothetical protein R3228_19115, partial [Halioglobus sp.]|nr:hypothetical protein [Halioglobus sp.]
AMGNLMAMLPAGAARWEAIRDDVARSAMRHLWDEQNQKFIPHLYLEGSPYPEDFDENAIYYHGGTAVAIEAGLLSRSQVKASLDKMVANVNASGAASIGLTLYPVYPKWAFRNPQMRPWNYQNGGDWSWFGGRMVQQLVRHGFVRDAYEQLLPMTARVVHNDGFYEWYTRDNKPRGSGTFRGSAGVLYKAILMLEEWATRQTAASAVPLADSQP